MVRLVLVGDVHGHWNTSQDAKALGVLKPDLVLFVGDFGDEDIEMIEEVSKLEMRKAVILGNHDSWWEGLDSWRLKMLGKKPVDGSKQLSVLGGSHIGYERMDVPELKVSVVGMRPFAIGGDQIYNKELVRKLYGIRDMQESAERIKQLASSAPEDHCLIFLGHNGPTGLGREATDICGRLEGGDNGDPDVEEAVRGCCNRVSLVAFGHMHGHEARKMCVVGEAGTVYVNAAVVPRVVRKPDYTSERNFTVVDFFPHDGKQVCRVAQCWVRVKDQPSLLSKLMSPFISFFTNAKEEEVRIVSERILYSSPHDTS